MKPRILSLLAFLLLVTGTPSPAEESSARVQWKMDETYTGPHTDVYNKLRWKVPVLMRQSLIDLAVRLGLDFQEGWSVPLTIRFVDTAPQGAENALAYVMMMSNGQSRFQFLDVNLSAYANQEFDFDKVFKHELAHAMLNDALSDEASANVPVWLHEGMAVYGADQGETMLAAYVQMLGDSAKDRLVNGLDGPHGALDYGEDYLAFKYIYDVHGLNSLHNFFKDLVRRQGDVKGAIEYTCGENWERFQVNARAYALKQIEQLSRDNRRLFQEPAGKPY
jgi:hypothetical protein